MAKKGMLAGLLAFLLVFLPTFSFAAGGENVRLVFSSSDKIYLFVSLALGFIALIVAVAMSNGLMKLSRGTDRMIEVGDAIRAGAMAYLRQQIRAMSLFVVLIGVGLFFMHKGSDGVLTSVYVSLAFVLGVAASYIAGYMGMKMAVEANTRTAAAALTSYAQALKTAFRSGAVAGLFTVGVGLLGATAIFLSFPDDAMKLLVGFGFGGSLAALFMRVGGGIFTKAADVGADLVGKVEAGIPEDDPRNPAVIADNVGDNVGDCAGMAADVFESYEVTLVAAIVLGAATAAVLDQETWMRLILFALMARGVGIVASLIGIYSVKGSDDLNKDPLKFISNGFKSSAIIAALGTAAVAYFMLGGSNPSQAVNAYGIQSAAQGQLALFDDVKAEQAAIADKKYKGDVKQVKAEDLKDVKFIKDLRLDSKEAEQTVTGLLKQPVSSRPEEKKIAGYTSVTLTDAKNPVLNYSVTKPVLTLPEQGQPQPEPQKITLKQLMQFSKGTLDLDTMKEITGADAIKKAKDDHEYRAWFLSIKSANPAGGPTAPNETKGWFGPMPRKMLVGLIKQAATNNMTVSILEDPKTGKKPIPVQFMANAEGKLAVGVPGFDMRDQLRPVGFDPMYFKVSPDEYKKIEEKSKTSNEPIDPEIQGAMETFGGAVKTAEWWRFFLCVFFGLLMAFAFEKLTNYYVSVDKKPVQEVAEVSSAGPAPMIIQGFSFGLESSVFSVLAIVVSLLAPLFIFPPAEFGGPILSFYGIALVGLGLLTTTGYILAMDTFGPISDNAQGVFEMSGAGHDNPEASRGVQRLDAAGNTTKALTKGFAIATAVVAAVALFHSYVEASKLTETGMRLEVPIIFLGLMIGGAAPYLFSAFSINAVGRAAFQLINEVRDQFRNDPGIMAGTSKPDYGRCVAIVTAAAQKELLGPGILAIFLPVAVAFGFSIGNPVTYVNGVAYNLGGAQALGGFLVGTIVSGQLLAVLLANSGGLWDNSKKLIEDGLHGGKGTEAHKAAVVCDTVGDPFKDTAGPALNPLIKVMNLVALLLAPIIIMPHSLGVLATVTGLSLLFLAFSFYWSKRGSMATGMKDAKAAPSAVE